MQNSCSKFVVKYIWNVVCYKYNYKLVDFWVVSSQKCLKHKSYAACVYVCLLESSILLRIYIYRMQGKCEENTPTLGFEQSNIYLMMMA